MLAVAIACSKPYGEATADAGGPGVTGQDVVSPDSEPPCTPYGPVGPPATDDDPSTQLPPFILAVDVLALSSPQGKLGFDLDGVCTCDTRPGNAHDGASSCTPKKATICDDDGGIDNAFGKLVSTFSVPGSSFDNLTKVNERIQSGRQTLLIYLRRYNGLANDRDVEIGMLPSDGVRAAGCPGSVVDGNGDYNPLWCGDDVWSTIPDGQVDDGTPVALANGYVNDYRIVVNLPATGRVPLGPVPLEFGTPIITGKLTPLNEDMTPRPLGVPPATEKQKRLFKLDEGQLGGRLVVSSLLAALGAAAVGSSSTDRVCQSVLYVQFRKEICDAIDIARAPSLDYQAGYACDAMSANIGFTAKPSVRGEAYREPLDQNDCLPVNGAPKVPTEFAPNYNCP